MFTNGVKLKSKIALDPLVQGIGSQYLDCMLITLTKLSICFHLDSLQSKTTSLRRLAMLILFLFSLVNRAKQAIFQLRTKT
ncbi:hypothetical protein HMI54_009620 [Coelomomyces lativittatus]|nr:hypothetical protein HMI54_009620 [Coelomomyces lativittatus]